MDIVITPNKLEGRIGAISSKSYAHRMLICAALADGESEIVIDNLSKDIEATISALTSLGATIKRKDNIFSVSPVKDEKDAFVDCNESGSTLRFLVPVGAALGKKCTFTGKGRLPERPMSPILDLLKANGVSVNDTFPIEIDGKLSGEKFRIDGSVSSQFITGLLLALPSTGGGEIEITGDFQSKSYVDITLAVMKEFGVDVTEKDNTYIVPRKKFSSGLFRAEGDWSNAAFFLAAGADVDNLNENSEQGDRKIKEILKLLEKEDEEISIDVSDIPDLVPIISVKSAARKGVTKLINAERLKLKESDRILSTVTMINNLGGKAEGTENSITICGKGGLRGGEVNSFNDHRIAMSAAIASVYCTEEVKIIGAEAVEKSYPDFYEDFRKLGGIYNVL
ncbi:MAG: 3-phosphoshikimate 1-carboxyvinyltransferase [Clostridia bacterium]|nr:3-phosphoshikimate 1-carboxyvinyltransferase [Clostridia bacterium]